MITRRTGTTPRRFLGATANLIAAASLVVGVCGFPAVVAAAGAVGAVAATGAPLGRGAEAASRFGAGENAAKTENPHTSEEPQTPEKPETGKFENPLFAFCMDTHDAKKRSLKEQAELLKELGYDGAGHLWLEDVPDRLQTLDAAGLKLFQIYVRATIDASQPPYDQKLKEIVPLLKGRGTMLALLITGGKPSDRAGDERAVQIVSEIAAIAAPSGVRVALYPHVNDWLERVDDGIRIARKVGKENVGVMFNFCHWLKVDDEKSLKVLLEAAKPHLFAVSINGSDSGEEIKAGKGEWIQPLGKGSYDMRAFLKALKEAGYKGPIGIQCYGIPGDARGHLTQSIGAWRKMRAALNRE